MFLRREELLSFFLRTGRKNNWNEQERIAVINKKTRRSECRFQLFKELSLSHLVEVRTK